MAICPDVTDPNRKEQLKAIKDGTYKGTASSDYANRAYEVDARITKLTEDNRILKDVNAALKKKNEEFELKIMELEDRVKK